MDPGRLVAPLHLQLRSGAARLGSEQQVRSVAPGEEVRAELRRFLRRLGPRFVLRRIAHPKVVRAGGTMPLLSLWQNVGSAPCYRPIRLAWRLTDAAGRRRVFLSRASVRAWMPGETDVRNPAFLENPPDLPPGPEAKVEDQLRLPADFAPGRRLIEAAFVDPVDRRPLFPPAIRGVRSGQWTAVSEATVAGSGARRGD